MKSHLFFIYESSFMGGTVPGGCPVTDLPPSVSPIAAEPTRQPTTKRRKRKNSTSSTSNSSAGTNANSTGSKKKTPAANLSLSSQVPVSLAFLLGLTSCLCPSSTSRGPTESLSCEFAWGRVGWRRQRRGPGLGWEGGREGLCHGNPPLPMGN